MQQSFESIPPYQLEAPEACHLLPSPSETVIGDDVYIMTRLNKLIDAMPPSPTNYKLFNRPVTPFDSNNLIIFSMTVNRFISFSFVYMKYERIFVKLSVKMYYILIWNERFNSIEISIHIVFVDINQPTKLNEIERLAR